MSQSDRATLARTLFALDARPRSEPVPLWGPGRMHFALFVLGCCLVLAGWIVLLAITLPINYVTRQWRLAWIGFDVALLAGLAVTGWAAWRRRQIVVAAALVTATLLCCDAWFDVLLSWGGQGEWQSIASALLVELPLAGLLLGMARRVLRTTVHAVWMVTGQQGDEPALSKVPLLGQPMRVVAEVSRAGRDRVRRWGGRRSR
ncbi:MAG TPA: hypothetical protein VFX70_22180 [Mycobacteriales bacterium]|nr:hypothetical protein [Mycobacteriales bacterium]